jgi:ribosome-associated toxin RatA of RatAB toxin-antitoxin module
MTLRGGARLLDPIRDAVYDPPMIVDERVRSRLERGEIVIDTVPGTNGREENRARALIAAPIERVWDAITDYDRYKEFMPFTRESTVRRREGDTVLFYTELAVPLKKVWYEIELKLDRPNWSTRWRLEDGSIEANEGSWQLERYGEGETAAQYTLYVEIGVPLPAFLVNRFTKGSLSSLLQAVRERVGDRKYR